jgi:phytoene synthase
MRDVVRTSREPMLGAIRLAWWRERLQELDAGGAPPSEPRLQEVAANLLPLGVTGRELAALEGPWLRLFDPFPWDIRVAEAIWFRGRYLFGLAGRLLGSADERLEQAGGLWAIVDAARHCSDGPSRALLAEHGRTFAQGLGGAQFPAVLRPLSMLAAVALRDIRAGEPFEQEGAPGRLAAMLAHRVTGRLAKVD